MGELGLQGGDLCCQLGDMFLGRHGEVVLLLVLGVSRLNLSSTVRVHLRLGM